MALRIFVRARHGTPERRFPPRSSSRGVLVFSLSMALPLILMFPGRTDAANVLRLGPFSFSASTSVAANYSTNVDQARPSDTELEQRDFFFIYGLNLAGEAPLGPRAQLNLSWSLEWERYLERTDLDTDEDDPLGNARIEIPWELGLGLTLSAFAAYDHSLETRETAFAGESRNQRDENTITSYGLALNYARGRLRAVADYISERERHVLEEFQDGDEDRETFSFITSYALLPRLRGVYEFERERTDSVRDPNDYTGPEDTYAIGFDVDLWLRPSLVYGFRSEREDGSILPSKSVASKSAPPTGIQWNTPPETQSA